MLLGSVHWLKLLETWLMGKSPPSMMSPDKLKRLVETLLNHSGPAALQLSRQEHHRSSRLRDGAMVQLETEQTLAVQHQIVVYAKPPVSPSWPLPFLPTWGSNMK